MKTSNLIALLLFMVLSSYVNAQMRQMVWPLPNAWDTMALWNGGISNGTKLMLDFHTEPPTLLELPNDPLYGPYEPISAICNRWGQLQFYSDNHRVWNGSHSLIENIDSLHSYIPENESVFSTVANATMILPFPGDSLDRYFSLWTMDYYHEGGPPLHLQYSVIDRYGGALGQGALLDEGAPNRPLGDMIIQEKLAAIKHGNGRDWWIICRNGAYSWASNSDTMISMLMTPSGIDTIQFFNVPRAKHQHGFLKASNNGTLLAETTYPSGTLFLYRFNRCTGSIEFTDSLSGPPNNIWFGLAFSTSDEYLYVGTGDRPAILLQLALEADTISNTVEIASHGGGRFFSHFSMAPNGKIYFTKGSYLWNPYESSTDPFLLNLGVINFPDAEGLSCGYDPEGFYLNGNTLWGIGLPNHPNYDLGPLQGSICDSLPDPVIASLPEQSLHSTFSITLFPNPASQEFTVSSSEGKLNDLVIYNALGQEVWRTESAFQNMPIYVAGWPIGVYTVIASTANGNTSKKQLLIQR